MYAEPTRLITLIDAALPQWQCGQCDTPGCLPYAEAIVRDGAAINLCIPGGDPMVTILAGLTGQPIQPVALGTYPLLADGRPIPVRAEIRAGECIGCTKCIDACPVDAILGTGKMMHTILADLCTGCELCLPPCPVDCIDLVPVSIDPELDYAAERQRQFQQDQIALRQRFSAKQARVEATLSIKLSASRFAGVNAIARPILEIAAAVVPPVVQAAPMDATTQIQLATLRSQIKKLEKQLSVMPDDAKKRTQLSRLQAELAAMTQSDTP
jgi:electron transport complex protein RnfB